MKSTILYKRTLQFDIQADFYSIDRACAPVIVYIHGGGFIFGNRSELSEAQRNFYADAGFALFSIDYRLAPESNLSDILEDVQDALHWLIHEGSLRFSIDPEKIAVIGSSAGGFLALSTGTFPIKPKAIVSFYGYGDISSDWAHMPSTYYLQKDRIPEVLARKQLTSIIPTTSPVQERFLFYVYTRQTGRWIQEIHHNDGSLASLSPIHQIDHQYPPTLLLHGTNDTDVPYEQSVYMRAALLKKGISAKLITIPNGDHVFDKDFESPIVQRAYEQVVVFLKTQLNV